MVNDKTYGDLIKLAFLGVEFLHRTMPHEDWDYEVSCDHKQMEIVFIKKGNSPELPPLKHLMKFAKSVELLSELDTCLSKLETGGGLGL